MTIEQLIHEFGGKTLEEMEKMTDAELDKYWEPYFNVTRPERQVKKEQKATMTISKQAYGGNSLKSKTAALEAKFKELEQKGLL